MRSLRIAVLAFVLLIVPAVIPTAIPVADPLVHVLEPDTASALIPAEISRMGARTVVGWNFPHGVNVQIHLRNPFYDQRPNQVVNDCNFDPTIKGSTRRPKDPARIYGWIYIGRTKFWALQCDGSLAQSTDFERGNRGAYIRRTRRAFRQIWWAVGRDFNRGQADPTQRFHVPLKGLRAIDSLVRDPATGAIQINKPVNWIKLIYAASSRVKSVLLASDGCGYVELRSPPGFTPPVHPPYCGRHM